MIFVGLFGRTPKSGTAVRSAGHMGKAAAAVARPTFSGGHPILWVAEVFARLCIAFAICVLAMMLVCIAAVIALTVWITRRYGPRLIDRVRQHRRTVSTLPIAEPEAVTVSVTSGPDDYSAEAVFAAYCVELGMEPDPIEPTERIEPERIERIVAEVRSGDAEAVSRTAASALLGEIEAEHSKLYDRAERLRQSINRTLREATR